ncbi:MAG: glutathione S-transferase N-terminal domain-containing protein [Alphaproteobacteria bacterium]
MQLWYSTASPYVRKVLSVLHYHELINNVELKAAAAFDVNSPHNKDNPLGRIPAFKTKDGKWLYDSRVIAEYIDHIGEKPLLFPRDSRRWDAIKWQAFGDGMMDNAVPVLAEKKFRQDGHLWTERHQQLLGRIRNSLTALEGELDNMGYELNIGSITLVCAIDWFEFRKQPLEIDIQADFPKAYAWAKGMNEQYDCLTKTQPKD